MYNQPTPRNRSLPQMGSLERERADSARARRWLARRVIFWRVWWAEDPSHWREWMRPEIYDARAGVSSNPRACGNKYLLHHESHQG